MCNNFSAGSYPAFNWMCSQCPAVEHMGAIQDSCALRRLGVSLNWSGLSAVSTSWLPWLGAPVRCSDLPAAGAHLALPHLGAPISWLVFPGGGVQEAKLATCQCRAHAWNSRMCDCWDSASDPIAPLLKYLSGAYSQNQHQIPAAGPAGKNFLQITWVGQRSALTEEYVESPSSKSADVRAQDLF